MNKLYSRINWKNFPSTDTALNALNLNKMDNALNLVDDRVITLDTTKLNKDDLNNNIKSWTMNETTGIITITKYDNSQILFDLNVEKIPVNFELSKDGILKMTTSDGTEFTANIGDMIPILTFNDSDTIAVSVSGEGINKTYSFSVKNGSITEDKLQPNFLADIRVESESAKHSADLAEASKNESVANALVSEGFAQGTQNGEDVTPDSPYYENNAKYWSKQAQHHSDLGNGKITIRQNNVEVGSFTTNQSTDTVIDLEGDDIKYFETITEVKQALQNGTLKNGDTFVTKSQGSGEGGGSGTNIKFFETLEDVKQALLNGELAEGDVFLTKSAISSGGATLIDDTMSDTSVNAVQNKTIKKYVDDSIATLGKITYNAENKELLIPIKYVTYNADTKELNISI